MNAEPVPVEHPDQLLLAHEALLQSRQMAAEGLHREAAQAAELAAERFDSASLALARARALRFGGDCWLDAGQPDLAVATLEWALASFAELEIDALADCAGCEAALAEAERRRGSLAAARSYLESAAAGFDKCAMPQRAAICRLNGAVVMHSQGKEAAAVELLGEVRKLLLQTRRADAVAICDFDLGVALHDLGDLDDAIEYLQQARAIFASLGLGHEVASCNQNIGVALQAMDRPNEALQRLREARAGFASLGRVRDAAQCDHNLAVVIRSMGDEVDADRLEAQALAAEASERRPEGD